MIDFSTILAKRGLDTCPTPLWKLKLTDDEYEQLRDLLTFRIQLYSSPDENPFIRHTRECALFYAEYWRREYTDGPHSKQMVYDALHPVRYVPDGAEHLYQAAKRGAKRLGIEIYNEDGRTQYFDSMLYQGGLPMKMVTAGRLGSVWDRFTRGLVNRKADFAELNLGKVATKNNSLQEYCNWLTDAVDADQYMLMPFYCQNETSSWFTYLKDLAKQERKRLSTEHPFSINWEFVVDTVGNKIQVKYVAKAEQELSPYKLAQYNLSTPNFFTIQAKVNGQVIDSFDYFHGYCRYAARSKHPYHDGDRISLYLADCGKEMATDELDLTVPHIMFRNREGNYELGNRIGRQESFLLMPEGWTVADSHSTLQLAQYDRNGTPCSGIRIPAMFQDKICVKKDEESIVFGSNIPIMWTEFIGTPIDVHNVDKTLYDVSRCKFSLCFEIGGNIINTPVHTEDVEFRDKWQTEWCDNPSYGEIFARIKTKKGLFVTPTNKFINIGEGFVFTVTEADDRICRVKAEWVHGNMYIEEGKAQANKVWLIRKEDVKDNKIHLVFVPTGNSRNQFTLTKDAPFKEFYINGTDGQPIPNDSWIPYADLDKCKYHLIGQNIKEYTFGTYRRELRWKNNKLSIIENGRAMESIPYDGSLLTLFTSRELLRSILDKTSMDIIHAEIAVSFTTGNGNTLSFAIKDNPFRVKQTGNTVVITGKNHLPINYKGSLKLLKLDDPEQELVLSYDEEYGYILPDEIKAWGKTLLIGRTRGRICPALVDLTQELCADDRWKNWLDAKTSIEQELAAASLNSPIWQRILKWFDRTQKDDIPATSILELAGVAHNAESLICLAFIKFAQTDKEDLKMLEENLNVFSSDLAFSWYWLQPYLKSIRHTVISHLDDDSVGNALLTAIFIKWAMTKGEKAMQYLESMSNPDNYSEAVVECLMERIAEFESWIKSICKRSLLEQYGKCHNDTYDTFADKIIEMKDMIIIDTHRMNDKEKYVEVHQDYINEPTSMFFNQFAEPKATGNELWMMKRVNAVVAHIRQRVNLFEQSDEIRRSIIFGRKACNRQFIIALNNQLIKSAK